jgi:hypothetical protein
MTSDQVLNQGFEYVLNWPLTVADKFNSKLIRLLGLFIWILWVIPGAAFSLPWLFLGMVLQMIEYVKEGIM